MTSKHLLESDNELLRRENNTLKSVIQEIWWMARRYADERSTFAPQIYNQAIRECLKLGIDFSTVDGIIWARDNYGRSYDHLTEAEATPGTNEALGNYEH